jgi:hypothetical protein
VWRTTNGTWTWTCAAAAAVRAGVAPGLFAEGSKRYSMSVKRPSGGTKESTLGCANDLVCVEGLCGARRREGSTNLTQGWKDGLVMVCELVNVKSISGDPAGV